MTHTLSAAGDLHTAVFGTVTMTAQLTVDGGVTITIWPTAHAGDAISYSYTDLALGRRRYAVIRQLARTGATAQAIADTLGADREHALAQVRLLLDEAQEFAAADPSRTGTRVVAAVAEQKQAMETDAERGANDALAARINAHLAAVHGACRADDQDEAEACEVPSPARADVVNETLAERAATLAALRDRFAATHPNVVPLAAARNARRRTEATR